MLLAEAVRIPSRAGSVFDTVLATVELGGIVRENHITRAMNERRAQDAGV